MHRRIYNPNSRQVGFLLGFIVSTCYPVGRGAVGQAVHHGQQVLAQADPFINCIEIVNWNAKFLSMIWVGLAIHNAVVEFGGVDS